MTAVAVPLQAEEELEDDLEREDAGLEQEGALDAPEDNVQSNVGANPKKRRGRSIGNAAPKRRKRGSTRFPKAAVRGPDVEAPPLAEPKKIPEYLDGVQMLRKDHRLKYKVLSANLDKLAEERARVQAELQGTERRIHKLVHEKNYLLDQLLEYEEGANTSVPVPQQTEDVGEDVGEDELAKNAV